MDRFSKICISISATAMLLMVTLGVMGCSEEDIRKSRQGYARQAASDLQYFHDARTDLCFARYDPKSLAEVECTEKVMKLVTEHMGLR